MVFTPIEDVLDGRQKGESVDIRGWVYRKRESKDNIFLVIRDATDVIQCTVKKGSSAWDDAKKVTIESSVALSGTVKSDRRAPGGFEISTKQLKIIGLAEIFPITKDQSKEFLRDVRHLWLRSRKMGAIMKVRSEVLKSTHEFFRKRRFIEVTPPMFISSACEGGATLFALKYFDRDLYLTQSAQLHLEALIYSSEKVYCVAPSFRAEKSRTIRHLTEYWHVEAEQAFATIEDMMCLEEDLVSYVCHCVSKQCQKELEILKVNAEELAKIVAPFERITYQKAVERLHKKGFKLRWGEDFGFNEERALDDEFEGPVFVYAYPQQIKAFYCKTYRDDPKLAMSVDLIVPRIGELTTGGARVDDKEELIEKLEEFGLKRDDYEWYIDLRKYGTVPHAGFGLGVERLLAWILHLENVMDTIPFPRTLRRFYP
ncbi:MAG: asparagine--tRNA ligase [Candidatus Bathyarchaeota archaeon]|nr:MAG: asparagine--tRNA ligase [Candidatus Bathyarchaeota archaeon]